MFESSKARLGQFTAAQGGDPSILPTDCLAKILSARLFVPQGATISRARAAIGGGYNLSGWATARLETWMIKTSASLTPISRTSRMIAFRIGGELEAHQMYR